MKRLPYKFSKLASSSRTKIFSVKQPDLELRLGDQPPDQTESITSPSGDSPLAKSGWFIRDLISLAEFVQKLALSPLEC
jgi:hypothetical protein